MSCTVKTKVLDDLKDKKVISNTREILDFKEFDKLNALYTKHAVEKYDLPTNGKLLMDAVPTTIKLGKGNRIRPTNERTIYRAVPNDKLMDLLDDIIINYKENINFESKNLEESIIDNNQTNAQYQLPQGREIEEFVASEKTIRDLAARMSDRIGIPVRFESDRSKEYKGKLENGTAVVNLAYATLDTPIHEILGHPIIRALKGNDKFNITERPVIKKTGIIPLDNRDGVYYEVTKNFKNPKKFNTKQEAEQYIKNESNQLYQNLLKELETGKGKEVLDRVKRDYTNKTNEYDYSKGEKISDEEYDNIKVGEEKTGSDEYLGRDFYEKRIGDKVYTIQKGEDANPNSARVYTLPTYSLDEQQEEAIVELLGLMTAEKLDKVKDGKLISLLKRLLKEMKAFMKQLLGQKEVEINKLPDNMKLGDIADLLAYSNSKLILPGNEVVYTTPDNQQFKSYAEASNHISELAKNVEDVDLSSIKFEKKSVIGQIDPITNKKIKNAKFIKGTEPEWSPDDNVNFPGEPDIFELQFDDGSSNIVYDEDLVRNYDEEVNQFYRQIRPFKNTIDNFIERNKEYEQSKEIIEEWKKVNNIQYNPEEVYSRGQEFVSVVGAYSNFDVNLMMQNLLQHIEDNQKAGGEFTISAFTKPVDRKIGHLEGGGGKIKFKLYPQSSDILWAANTDAYSGSVWDASEKVNKDKKSELLGVSYTKYPSLSNVNTVQPNLANIIDNLAHHHNELGISLTGSNFRLEYDEDIPYQTKKIIDGINKILDQKYGKLVKPEIKSKKLTKEEFQELKNLQEAQEQSKYLPDFMDETDFFTEKDQKRIIELQSLIGIQPTQTNETLKESVSVIKNRTLPPKVGNWRIISGPGDPGMEWAVEYILEDGGGDIDFFSTKKEAQDFIDSFKNATGKEKEYTSQALINTKVSKLKEVAKKYPRSLIRSEVRPIPRYEKGDKDDKLFGDDLPFQKIPSKDIEDLLDKNKKDILFSEDNTQDDNNNESFESNNLNEFILFNNQDGNFTAKDILNNIKNNFRNFTPAANELIDKLIPILDKTQATIKFVNRNVFKYDDVVMRYNTVKNEIQISRDVLNEIDEEHAVRTFLHEVVHSVTVGSFNNPKTVDQEMFRSFINEMYLKYKTLSGYNENDALSESNYGFTKPEEFIAEIMTNVEFQNEIKALDKTGLWDKIVDYIRSLIGLSKKSDYKSIIDAITTISQNINGEQNIGDDIIFQKRSVKEKIPFTKVRSIEDKASKLYDNILNVIEHNIRTYDHFEKQAKDPTKIKKHNKKQKDLLESIKDLEGADKWKGIAAYIGNIDNNVRSLTKGFAKEDLKHEDVVRTVSNYKKYLQANSYVKAIKDLLADAEYETNLPITKDELQTLINTINEVDKNKSSLETKFIAFNKQVAFDIFNKSEHSREVLYNWRKRLKKEHKDLKISQNFEEWFVSQIEDDGPYAEEFKEDVKNKALEIINDRSFDIGLMTNLFNSSLNINSDLVQLMTNLISTMKNNITDRRRDLDLMLQPLYEEFIKAKGNKKPSELYKNLYETTKDGDTILKGKYKLKFKEEYEQELDKYNEEKDRLINDKGENSADYKNYIKNSPFQQWIKDNLKTIENEDGKKYMLPADKWLTDESQLSPIELKVLKRARVIFAKANKETFGINSLKTKTLFTAEYYKLPSVTKRNLERGLEGKTKGILKDAYKDITEIRPDDHGYEERYTSADGVPILQVQVKYRGKLDPDQQSLDLFTLMAAEGYNGISYQEKYKAESSAEVLLDVTKDKKFYQTDTSGKAIVGKFLTRDKRVDIDGEKTNTYKQLKSLMEVNVYDIMHKSMGTWGPVDLNKAISWVNGYTAMLGLSLNEVSAAANVLNGKSQLWLEAIGGNYITYKNIFKAEKKYFADLKDNFKDIGKPVSTSNINQLTEMYNTYGVISQDVQQAFIKNTMLRANLDLKSLQFLHSAGEHYMQSVLTMAVLDNIKVMNGKGEFINKDGNVVKTKEEAASLLDMHKKNDKGKLILDERVVYTTHTLGLKYKEGGREKLTSLVKKKVFDTAGNYDPTTQPEAKRHGLGKLGMLYRGFFVPLGMARFRGFKYGHKDFKDLEAHQKFFSEALQEYETGTYTETLRYILTAVKPALLKFEFKLLSSKWDEMTDFQKRQVIKGVSEIIFTGVLLPIITALFVGLAEGGDDDDYLWFLALQARRLQSELSSYRDPREQWKIIKSPIPSLRLFETVWDITSRVASPTDWDERIKSGPNKDELKFLKSLEDLIPIFNNSKTTYKKKYQYIDNVVKM